MHDDWGVRTERWRGIRSETIDVHGTAVHALRAGDDTPGVPQLLVHGLGGSATNWIEVAARLAERGPVLAPDLPGFGRTEPPRRNASRIRHNARFLRALLDTVGWDRAEVHGNSMGGMLAVLLADAAPERVERLVLVSPALPPPSRDPRALDPMTVKRFVPFLVPGLGEPIIQKVYASMTPAEQFEDTIDLVYGDADHVSPELREVAVENIAFGRTTDWRIPGMVGAAESLVGLVLRRGRLRRAVTAVQAPTLVVWGERDRLVSRAVVDGLAEQRPDWTLSVFPDVGHVPQVEAPARYVDAVVDFVRGHAVEQEVSPAGTEAVDDAPRPSST